MDEFQDISRARAGLLSGLLKHSPECKMFAVGDDWQSIYRFAGSDISIFTHFEENFGATAINFLTQTFRSNQGIAEVAARFIQRNSAQVKKSVVASDKTVDNVIVIRKVEKREHVPAQILACLEDAAATATKSGERRVVFLLGRYNHQYPDGLKEWREKFGKYLDLEFKTIHGSKGLQAVKRNQGRFPDDFMFQLTWEEAENPRSQIVTLKPGENIKYRPFAFTEQGIAMLSSVLRSERAVRVNIEIMRAFVQLRQMLSTHADLARKLKPREE